MSAPILITSPVCDSSTPEPEDNAAGWAAVWSTLPLLVALPAGLRVTGRAAEGRFRSYGDALAVRVRGDVAEVLDSGGRWLRLGDPGVVLESDDSDSSNL